MAADSAVEDSTAEAALTDNASHSEGGEPAPDGVGSFFVM